MSEMRIFDSGAERERQRVAPSATPDAQTLRGRIIEAIKSVYDPEIPVNVFDLGLIYAIEPESDGQVRVAMTLTSPACPEAHSIPAAVKAAVETAEGVVAARVELVWEPRWSKDMMSDEAKLHLGLI